MGAPAGPQGVVDAARAARSGLSAVVAPSEVTGTREEWATAVAELQAVIDVASAAQDVAIVRLAAIEPEVREDGEVVETHRVPGHVALDAPALVSGVLCCTAVHAERRVRAAVRLAADGPEGSARATGLGGLHAAMTAGRLDGYRAQVVAAELEEVPAAVAATVVAGLAEWFEREDAPRLRRRARRMLARISPDLLRQRAVRARAESRLERWVDEPGVDTWHGTFPSEEAATAWAAVDALAQRYLADGVCADIGRARAKALTDLVAGNATVEVQVTVLASDAAAGVPATADATVTTDAAVATDAAVTTDAAVAATRVPTDAAVPAASGDPARSVAVRDSDLVEVGGLRPGDPVLVHRRWLLDAVSATGLRRDRHGRPVPVPPARSRPDRRLLATLAPLSSDPAGGALTAPAAALATPAYRPTAALVAFVRARDGRCRFPGCHVAARFCDVDHVRPWPTGPTSAANLVCLCRRHHRVKQRPGWHAQLHPDATMTWTDPTGRTRTTLPVDHRLTVLPDIAGTDATDNAPGIRAGTSSPTNGAAGTATGPGTRATATGAFRLPAELTRRVLPDGPHSHLEHHLEHLTACRPRLVLHRLPVRSVYTGRGCRTRGEPAARHPDDPPF